MSLEGAFGQSTDSNDPSRTPIAYGLRVLVLVGSPLGACAVINKGGVRVGSAATNDIVLEDRKVSRNHLEIFPHPAGALVRDLGSRNGSYVGGIRVTEAVAPPGSIIALGGSELIIEPDSELGDIPLSEAERLGSLLGRSAVMRRVFTVLERAAPTDYTVLIQGETGTGKEVVARTIHELSPRRHRPFVVFDCAATAESVLESELFGHVRGAFTGALASREGAFRRAHEGTLFIDELTSLSLPLQGRLLRALEDRQIRPVGADHDVSVDLRVVAATNRPLQDEMRAGRFREDLYFRMSVICVQLPPLRDRREDIPLLVAQFLRAAGIDCEPRGPMLERLRSYGWPGNLRELRNTVERALALVGRGQDRLTFDEIPFAVGDATVTYAWPMPLDLPFKDAKEHLVEAFERVYATHLLDRVGGNISEAARRSGLSRRHFFELVKKYELGKVSDPDVDE